MSAVDTARYWDNSADLVPAFSARRWGPNHRSPACVATRTSSIFRSGGSVRFDHGERPKRRHDRGGGMARRTHEELDRLAIKAAVDRWERRLPATEVIDTLKLRGDRELRRLLARATDRDHPLVKVQVKPVVRNRPTDGVKSERLAKLAQVEVALVTQTSIPTDPPLPEGDLADELHRQVGEVAARYLLEHLRPNDLVGLGAGRGVNSTIEAITSLVGERAFPDLHLVSLSGGGLVRQWGERMDRFIDADEAVVELAVLLNVRPANVRRVQLPIVLRDKIEVVPRVAPHVSDEEWSPRTPDIVLVGLGVLNTNHNIMVTAAPPAGAIAEQVSRLEDRILSQFNDAVIDVCNNFHVRRGVEGLSRDLEQEARELVDILNSRVVTVPLWRIDQAREKIVVGAGLQKLGVWIEMLENYHELRFRPTVIVTDSATADQLIAHLEATRDRTRQSGSTRPDGESGL